MRPDCSERPASALAAPASAAAIEPGASSDAMAGAERRAGQATRTQLSLYVPAGAGGELEAARRLLDPVQSQLIPAHVTLCRQDELAGISAAQLGQRLGDPRPKPLRLQFGRPERFDGHGVLLRCIGGAQAFQRLRVQLLGGAGIDVPAPHITLAHPRNPKSAGNCDATTDCLPAVQAITFAAVCLIEQHGAAPWNVVRRFALAGS